MKWEYQILRWDVPYAGRSMENEQDEVTAKLNEIGAMGWELVRFDIYGGHQGTNYFSIWKRSMP